MKKVCAIKDCGNEIIHAKGMCEMHYRQVLSGKDITYGRPSDWGTRANHPLYEHWYYLKRRINRNGFCERWKNFWDFVEDVGFRPGKEYWLKLIDKTKPYSKENYVWKERIVCKRKNEDGKAYSRRYARVHRLVNPEYHKNISLKRYFGINLEDYRLLSEKQDGLCVICNKKESAINPRTGKPRDLAVDHCHNTNKIRGLLCSKCNVLIGSANDSIEILESAIRYLKNSYIFGGIGND